MTNERTEMQVTEEKAYAFDEFGAAQKAKVMIVSKQIGKSMWNSKGGKQRNESPGCELCAH